MTESAQSPSQPESAIPADDPKRALTVVHPDSPTRRHVSIAGGTYTILVSGDETAGRYCLIDLHVPSGGGPQPHRHDFEEMFTLLEGELEFTFRGQTATVRAGSTVNIPRQRRRTPSATSPALTSVCCAWPRRPGWTRSSWRSVTPLTAEAHHRRSTPQRKSPSGR